MHALVAAMDHLFPLVLLDAECYAMRGALTCAPA